MIKFRIGEKMKKIISAFILILMLCFIGCTQIDFNSQNL